MAGVGREEQKLKWVRGRVVCPGGSCSVVRYIPSTSFSWSYPTAPTLLVLSFLSDKFALLLLGFISYYITFVDDPFISWQVMHEPRRRSGWKEAGRCPALTNLGRGIQRRWASPHPGWPSARPAVPPLPPRVVPPPSPAPPRLSPSPNTGEPSRPHKYRSVGSCAAGALLSC